MSEIIIGWKGMKLLQMDQMILMKIWVKSEAKKESIHCPYCREEGKLNAKTLFFCKRYKVPFHF